MSTVPISEYVNVSIALAPTPQGLAGFGSLLMLSPEASAGSNPINTTERVRQYSSMSAVAEDFPSGEINKAATAYYAQQPKPVYFLVGLVSGAPTPATATGSSEPLLADLQAVTAGGFTMTIDGTDVTISAIDLSGETSLSAIAGVVSTAMAAELAGTICFYNGVQFEVVSPTTGESSTITVASADVGGLAAAMKLLSATLTQGSSQETVTQALSKCEEVDGTFYGVVLDSSYDDTDSVLSASDWVQARTKVMFNTTSDRGVLEVGNESTIAGQIDAKENSRTLSVYAPIAGTYAGASVAGRAFTVNFEGTNTTITLMYKKLPTIPVAKLTSTQNAKLQLINCNVFLDVGSNSFFAESKMAGGSYFDTIHGTDWLQNRIETDVFNLLYQSTTKVPYTDTGVGMIIQKVEQGLRQGVRNGLIAPGNTTDGTYLELGYQINYVPVSDVSSADKGNRIYRGITFIAVGAGAIHKVVITGSFSE
mgnify:CR=1 FL=1|jgi:hypothetical protein